MTEPRTCGSEAKCVTTEPHLRLQMNMNVVLIEVVYRDSKPWMMTRDDVHERDYMISVNVQDTTFISSRYNYTCNILSINVFTIAMYFGPIR